MKLEVKYNIRCRDTFYSYVLNTSSFLQGISIPLITIFQLFPTSLFKHHTHYVTLFYAAHCFLLYFRQFDNFNYRNCLSRYSNWAKCLYFYTLGYDKNCSINKNQSKKTLILQKILTIVIKHIKGSYRDHFFRACEFCLIVDNQFQLVSRRTFYS